MNEYIKDKNGLFICLYDLVKDKRGKVFSVAAFTKTDKPWLKDEYGHLYYGIPAEDLTILLEMSPSCNYERYFKDLGCITEVEKMILKDLHEDLASYEIYMNDVFNGNILTWLVEKARR